MWTKLHWVDGPWRGQLALAARPRGGEWLADEIASWRREGVNVVLSLLTPDEETDLDLRDERAQTDAHDMAFVSLPIEDRHVPETENTLADILQYLDAELASGRNVVLHCRQGVGRTGLVAACLLITNGLDSDAAVRRLSAARGISIPETPEQRHWIDHYAGTLAGTR